MKEDDSVYELEEVLYDCWNLLDVPDDDDSYPFVSSYESRY